jgi:CelD/BcsL family acetyltransferase involved in cellulose biosynthesis
MEMQSGAFPPLRTLHSVTNAHSFRFQIPMAPGEEGAMDAALHALRDRARPWDVIELERFPTGFPADRELMRAARSEGLPAGIWQGGLSPYVPIREDWESYFQSLKPKFRSNLRNRLKRLEKTGRVAYEEVTDPAETADALEDAFEIERSGWKGERGSAIASDPSLTSFYREWGELAAGRGWLRLWFLRVGGARAAFEYDVEYKGVLYCLKIGYRPELHPFSPGQILKARVLEEAFRTGLREYDFLGVMDEAKGSWTSEGRPFNWAYVYNRSPMARLHHAMKFFFKPRVKAVLER